MFKMIVRILGICLLPIVIGCQHAEVDTVTATGSVMGDARPLSGAVITLEPIKNTTGPNASAPVFDGNFSFHENAGLHGGTYRVRVEMIPAEIRKNIPADQFQFLPPPNSVIAPAYDAESQVTCELVPNQPNELTFQVAFLR